MQYLGFQIILRIQTSLQMNMAKTMNIKDLLFRQITIKEERKTMDHNNYLKEELKLLRTWFFKK